MSLIDMLVFDACIYAFEPWGKRDLPGATYASLGFLLAWYD